MTKRIFRSIFTVAAVILLASFVLITGVLYEYFSNKQVDQLNMQTHLAAQGLEAAGEDYLSDMDISGCRLTWIAADGTVLYDSQAEQSGMENHADREEVRQALKTGHGESMRYSTTLMERQIYSADRLSDGTVVPCCLDHEGTLALGNLFRQELADMLAAPLARAMREGFERGERAAPLCRRCGYAERFGAR